METVVIREGDASRMTGNRCEVHREFGRDVSVGRGIETTEDAAE